MALPEVLIQLILPIIAFIVTSRNQTLVHFHTWQMLLSMTFQIRRSRESFVTFRAHGMYLLIRIVASCGQWCSLRKILIDQRWLIAFGSCVNRSEAVERVNADMSLMRTGEVGLFDVQV